MDVVQDLGRVITRLRLTDDERRRLAEMLDGRARPAREGRQLSQRAGWPTETVDWWQSLLDAGGAPFWPGPVLCKELVNSFAAAVSFPMSRRGYETLLGRFLAQACPGCERRQRAPARHRRQYFYLLPSLAEARAEFELFRSLC